MNLSLRVALLVALVFYFIMLFHLLKRNRLNLKYTLLWILSGLLMLAVVIFPWLLEKGVALIGVQNPMNGLYALVIFLLIILLMSVTSIVSTQNEKIKTLIQTIALLEKRMREWERR